MDELTFLWLWKSYFVLKGFWLFFSYYLYTWSAILQLVVIIFPIVYESGWFINTARWFFLFVSSNIFIQIRRKDLATLWNYKAANFY